MIDKTNLITNHNPIGWLSTIVKVYNYILIYIIGGSVTAGLGIYDTMQYVLPPIATWCIGQACSMGSLLLCAGEPGMRYSLPNSRVMIHQPSGQATVRQNNNSFTPLPSLSPHERFISEGTGFYMPFFQILNYVHCIVILQIGFPCLRQFWCWPSSDVLELSKLLKVIFWTW